MTKVSVSIAPAFEDFIFDWDYETYLLVGGYGSGKSYDVAIKIVLKLLEEKRKCLVVREVFDTIFDSCYSLLTEIIDSWGLLCSDTWEWKMQGKKQNKILCTKSPLRIRFPNGSEILFKGMDKPEKVKSINGVSIVWIEEAPEVKYAGYEELQGRIRTPDASMHFILSCNPVSKETWIYRHFFARLEADGSETVLVDENEFYRRGCMVKNGVYYHHSIPTDNPWLPKSYIKRLDAMESYDPYLYEVARWGRFGATGLRVLPQFCIAKRADVFKQQVEKLGIANQFFGFDFGFEESFNAVISMSVDQKRGILYIWDEIYMNHVTDDKFAALPEMQRLKARIEAYNAAGYPKMIVADNEDPKAISYYRQMGFKIRKCRNKFAGSRLSNTRKIKRFKKIVCSPKCRNTIRELRDLTYAKANNGDTIYDQFNIDPHSFSAIWYALDTVTVADVKDKRFYSKRGW